MKSKMPNNKEEILRHAYYPRAFITSDKLRKAWWRRWKATVTDASE